MKHIISSTALVMALSMTPALAAANSYGGQETAHERCKRAEDNRQVLGGLAGAVVGGVFGSQISGNGARTEGSAIGAVLGGLAGVGIADKTIDCDPVYDNGVHQTSGASYPTGSYPQGSYPSGSYPTGSYPTSSTTYGGSTQSYGSSTSYGSSQPYYEDRVTVSNHPVYSDPTYGAGGVSQGTTYSAGTVSYPPSGNNSQYASRTYSSTPSYQTTPTYGTSPTYSTTQGARVYTAATQPVYHQPRTVVQPVYRSAPPVYRTRPPARRIGRHTTHYHGKYSCDMHH